MHKYQHQPLGGGRVSFLWITWRGLSLERSPVVLLLLLCRRNRRQSEESIENRRSETTVRFSLENLMGVPVAMLEDRPCNRNNNTSDHVGWATWTKKDQLNIS